MTTQLSQSNSWHLLLSFLAPQEKLPFRPWGRSRACRQHKNESAWCLPHHPFPENTSPQKPAVSFWGGVLTSPYGLPTAQNWSTLWISWSQRTRLKSHSLWVTAARSRAKLLFESFISSYVSCQPYEGFPQKLPRSLCFLSVLQL